MKTGFVIGDLSHPGGGERVVVNLANSLVNNNEEAVIFHYGKNSKYSIDNRVKVISIDGYGNNWLLRKMQRAVGFYRISKKNNIDLLISFGWGPSIYVAFICGNKVPFVASERIDPLSEPSIKLFRFLRNMAYKKAKLLICQTDDAARFFYDYNTRIILNPIKEGLPNRFLGKRRKAIVNFCRFTRQKNLVLLINAFAIFEKKHKDFVLELYGYGPLKKQLIQLVYNLKIEEKVSFFSFTENVHSRIVDASMYVSTSIYEGLSNSMLEAMAIGLPTICTDCPIGGARMVIQNYENGIIVPLNDENRLVEAMTEVADSDLLQKQLSEKAYLIREKLSEKNIINEWHEVINQYGRT